MKTYFSLKHWEELKGRQSSPEFEKLYMHFGSGKSISPAHEVTCEVCLFRYCSRCPLPARANISLDFSLGMSAAVKFYNGKRLSFGGDLCTVRFIGEVEGTKGEWLGVEWDDPSRGKHDGSVRGVKYFQCMNSLS